jgi:hypothetical protein
MRIEGLEEFYSKFLVAMHYILGYPATYWDQIKVWDTLREGLGPSSGPGLE